MSSMGITQISAVWDRVGRWSFTFRVMSDEALIVNKTGTIFLAGSYLVKAAIGEDIDNETLGGAQTHCEISGVTDYKSENDEDCSKTIQNIFSKIETKANFNRIEPRTKKDKMKLGILLQIEINPITQWKLLSVGLTILILKNTKRIWGNYSLWIC